MKLLPCGHGELDITGTFCRTCKTPAIEVDSALPLVRQEASHGDKQFERDAIREGFRYRAAAALRGRREFLAWLTVGFSGAALGSTAYQLARDEEERGERRRDARDAKQRTLADWQRIIRSIDDAAEEKHDKLTRLRALASDYRAGGMQIAADLCEGAIMHLCTGEPSRARVRYAVLRDSAEDWERLPPIVQRHVLTRLGKVSNNVGDHEGAIAAFQQILDGDLHSRSAEATAGKIIPLELETIRELLNAWYQTLPATALLHTGAKSELEAVVKMKELLRRAAAVLNVKDIREVSERHGGLRPGIAIFSEIVDYLETHQPSHLEAHLRFAGEMMIDAKQTGWNRHSQYVALALSGGELDYAHRGLLAASAKLLESGRGSEIEEQISDLAESPSREKLVWDPGPIELAVHLAMWGQYYFALETDRDTTLASERTAVFFRGARELLDDSEHERFIRDLDRFLTRCEVDPLQQAVPGQVRSYALRAYRTGVFLPLAPESLPDFTRGVQ